MPGHVILKFGSKQRPGGRDDLNRKIANEQADQRLDNPLTSHLEENARFVGTF
jgi:hypothetical protein